MEYHWREKRKEMAIEEMMSGMARMGIEEREYHMEMDAWMLDLGVEEELLATWEEEWIIECLDRLEQEDFQMEVRPWRTA